MDRTANIEEYLYWTGCAANFDERIANVVKATVKILRAAGIRVRFLREKEVCSGDAARRMGEEGLFQQLALQNIETLKTQNVKRIVTHCAHCFNLLKNEYPRFGCKFDVVHHSELIAQLVREGHLVLTKEYKENLTLHDSCYVGRYNRIFDSPREVLRAVGVSIREMPQNRENSFCCGAGGANYWYDVPKKEPAGNIRVREAIATGANVLAAECPFCIKMFEQGLQQTEEDVKMTVKDISEVVAEALDS